MDIKPSTGPPSPRQPLVLSIRNPSKGVPPPFFPPPPLGRHFLPFQVAFSTPPVSLLHLFFFPVSSGRFFIMQESADVPLYIPLITFSSAPYTKFQLRINFYCQVKTSPSCHHCEFSNGLLTITSPSILYFFLQNSFPLTVKKGLFFVFIIAHPAYPSLNFLNPQCPLVPLDFPPNPLF